LVWPWRVLAVGSTVVSGCGLRTPLPISFPGATRWGRSAPGPSGSADGSIAVIFFVFQIYFDNRSDNNIKRANDSCVLCIKRRGDGESNRPRATFRWGGVLKQTSQGSTRPPPSRASWPPPPSEVGPRSIKVRTCYLAPDIFLAFTSSEKLALFCLF